MGGAEESHQDHGNRWPRRPRVHNTQEPRGKKKKQMMAGGTGWSLTPTFDCYEQWDSIQATSAHVTLFLFNIFTRSLRQNICISSPAKTTNVESFYFTTNPLISHIWFISLLR